VHKPILPITAIYAVLAVVALAVFGVGLYLAIGTAHQWTMLAAGCVCLLGVGMTWPLARALESARQTEASVAELDQRINNQLQQIAVLMGRISEQQLLSDRAKSVAFRDKEREAIRRAINEELSQGEWEAAVALADQFEKAFGSKAEADRFRAEIEEKRAERLREQIAAVMVVIDRHTRSEQWSAALREAEKLMQRFPNSEQVKSLPQEIEARRQNHKKQLVQSWHEALARQDNDAGIDILKQLDAYLTPAEAESMQEQVRHVFKERLNNLVAQFGAAVHGQRWADAVRVGEQIQSEFPNSRAAQEARQKMDALRHRANEPAAANA